MKRTWFYSASAFLPMFKKLSTFLFSIFFPALCGISFNWGSNHNESLSFRSAKNEKQSEENETNSDFTTRISHLMCCQTGFELMKMNTCDGSNNAERGEKNRESESWKTSRILKEIRGNLIDFDFVGVCIDDRSTSIALSPLSHSPYADFIMVYVATYQSK